MNRVVRAEVEGRVSESGVEARSMLGDQEGKMSGLHRRERLGGRSLGRGAG